MSDFLTREDLTRPLPRRFKEFEIQYNGCVKRVRIQSLTEKERAALEVGNLNAKGEWKLDLFLMSKPRLISACVVDENGNRLLQPQDVRILSEQDGAMTAKIFDECFEHCGFRTAKAELFEKNSDATDAGTAASS